MAGRPRWEAYLNRSRSRSRNRSMKAGKQEQEEQKSMLPELLLKPGLRVSPN